MNREAWILGMYLVTGAIDALVKLAESGKVKDVTPEEVQAATEGRNAMMERARAAGLMP